MKLLLALLALALVPAEYRPTVARSYEQAAKTLGRDAPRPELVAAVVYHESRGRSNLCREDKGGSSRGLMQIWRPHSRCDAESVARFPVDGSPARNVAEGTRRLAAAHVYEREVCRKGHDYLVHYAGSSGRAGRKFAREVRALARQFLKEAKKERNG